MIDRSLTGAVVLVSVLFGFPIICSQIRATLF
jgi:hypothetical protein